MKELHVAGKIFSIVMVSVVQYIGNLGDEHIVINRVALFPPCNLRVLQSLPHENQIIA